MCVCACVFVLPPSTCRDADETGERGLLLLRFFLQEAGYSRHRHLGFVVSDVWQRGRFYSTMLHPSVSIIKVTLNNPLRDRISKTETRYPAPRTCSNSSKQIDGTRRVRCRNGISHISVVLSTLGFVVSSREFHQGPNERTYPCMIWFLQHCE
jgi:hypothetical protein